MRLSLLTPLIPVASAIQASEANENHPPQGRGVVFAPPPWVGGPPGPFRGGPFRGPRGPLGPPWLGPWAGGWDDDDDIDYDTIPRPVVVETPPSPYIIPVPVSAPKGPRPYLGPAGYGANAPKPPYGPPKGMGPPGGFGPPAGFGPASGYRPGGSVPSAPNSGVAPQAPSGGISPPATPAAPVAPAAPAAPAAAPQGATGFKLTPGSSAGPLSLSVAVPNTQGSSDFIGSLSGKGIGWGAVSVGGGMLNKVLVGVQIPGSSPSGALLYATHYGIPSPLNNPNMTITPIAAETYVKGGDWKYTFLCKGCLSLSRNAPGFGGSSGQATFGYAYATTDRTIRRKHDMNGHIMVDLNAAKTDNFAALAKGA